LDGCFAAAVVVSEVEPTLVGSGLVFSVGDGLSVGVGAKFFPEGPIGARGRTVGSPVAVFASTMSRPGLLWLGDDPVLMRRHYRSFPVREIVNCTAPGAFRLHTHGHPQCPIQLNV